MDEKYVIGFITRLKEQSTYVHVAKYIISPLYVEKKGKSVHATSIEAVHRISSTV